MKLAVVFPGQGSQSIGMLSDLAQVNSVVQDTFAQASDVLGYDLWQLTQEGSADKLNQTEITQPAMLASGVAVYRICEQIFSELPSVMAGHSLGEYTALVASGAIDFVDSVELVSSRGRLMQEAVPNGTGAMAAILGLDDNIIVNLCKEVEGVVEAVNFNSLGQVVIAGAKTAVESACVLAKKAGAKRALVLPVSVPSHSSLMKPAADKFANSLSVITINPPQIPVINNVDAKAEIDPDAIRSALIRQLYNPVLWVSSIQNMVSQGITHIIEAGPGKVLTGLSKRIDKSLRVLPVESPDTLQKAIDSLTQDCNKATL